jgi:hypothetical protein
MYDNENDGIIAEDYMEAVDAIRETKSEYGPYNAN